MNRFWKTAAGAVTLCFVTAGAMAEFSKPEDAVKYRKAMMGVIAQHFNVLGDMVKGKAPFDPAVAFKNAGYVNTATGLAWEAFRVAGSDKGDTTMKSDALKDPEAFTAAVEAFKKEVQTLADVALAGDEGAFKSQFGVAAQSCKACHGKFRK